ncbi:Sec7-domain-containing protein [Auricularia subglabra TFB-10046 SS5]|nr:Sec7-domain-containing protein [Auricularia subglabra TFB-10046 SS5]
MIKAGQGGDKPREIFEPLRLACETRNEKLMIASLDCISKLISYSFLVEDGAAREAYNSPPASPTTSSAPPQPATLPLVDLVTHTITSCYTESTPDAVSLQIVKALLALVLSPVTLVHHSSLLKAVRTVYNVFLLSQDPVNQVVAQGGLTQIVNHVFARCHAGTANGVPESAVPGGPGAGSDSLPRTSLSSRATSPYPESSRPSSSLRRTSTTSTAVDTIPDTLVEPSETPLVSEPASVERDGAGADQTPVPNGSAADGPAHANGSAVDLKQGPPESATSSEPPAISLDTFENPNPNDEVPEQEAEEPRAISDHDLFLKDAFLVFRALCKLTMKPLNTESERDLKSHAMRSKLLSLHLVQTILSTHMNIFVSPSSYIYSSSSRESTPFIQATKQYLCLALSRNAVSPVPQVFEISVEIFWRVLSGMRKQLKREIEVLLNEIFIPILEMRNATAKQKGVLLNMLSGLCQDPQALVEIYLNYDCDKDAIDNIYERLMNVISKIGTQTPVQHKGGPEPASPVAATHTHAKNPAVPPSLSTTALGHQPEAKDAAHQNEVNLRRLSLECLVFVLRSLVAWGTTAGRTVTDPSVDPQTRSRPSFDASASEPNLADRMSTTDSFARVSTPDLIDDPGKFESAKQMKTTLNEGIKKFNFKPKKGIEFFLDTGFIPSNTPQDIARFLLETEGLSKAAIGEYMGEGDDLNVAVMHAFIDMLDFTELNFLDSLRLLLQSFRLPGEAQKIDRYVLKFAARFMECKTTTPFKNADAAYVLSYSVILLNTDAHNPQVKKRMTKTDFLKNNRGINDGTDLPEEFLNEIYDDIVHNEIRMKDEVEAMTGRVVPGAGLGALSLGRDLQKEAYALQSSGMANKTEQLFRTMMRAQKKGSKSDQYFSASHFVHVKPMFEVAWMPVLAGISGPLQDTDDLEIVELCLDGFKNAIRIVCFFDLELERNAFVTTLAKFTFLNNLGEMKSKNMEAIKTLLDIAVTDGNQLKGSWHEVLTCVSQLERMQLISSGVDVGDSARKALSRKALKEELANESRSTHITVAADMVFSLSHYLSGTAIVDFVQALSDVSWEEIQSSGMSQHPRMFSLQKLVEISYYNMNRIRLEWSNMWVILGEHFNQVCTHSNVHVAFFALDALRQLAMRFLEKEELPHFKFQKDFLKPFEYTMINNANPDVRDMVLQCLHQMIQARVHNMRSGWRTMFGVFSASARVVTERIPTTAFEIVTRLYHEHFPDVVRHGSFADLTVCMGEFCKVSKFQKISLSAMNMLRTVVPTMLASPECAISAAQEPNSTDDPMVKFWYPILFAFYDIIMNGEDIEVRRLALDSLFNTLKEHGPTFPVEFWDTICREILFPIFAVLKSKKDFSRFSTEGDMSVWLSTTMIQALRDLIDLYTFFFDTMERFLDGLLDLLSTCILQENDTLARIGTSCLQQLLEKNAAKLSNDKWERVIKTLIGLFKLTTPHQLYDEKLRADISEPEQAENEQQYPMILPAPLSPITMDETPEGGALTNRKRIFKQIIVKCVLQLLLIETVRDLLQNHDVYRNIPPQLLLRLLSVLEHSYQFARAFNDDKELRTGLWKVGFMKHLPNLLKQESSSAATLVTIYLRMYNDPRPDYMSLRQPVADRLLPLGQGVIQDFNKLKIDSQGKNIAAWSPVVAELLRGFNDFDDQTFTRYLPAIYPLATDLMARDMTKDIRESLKSVFTRVGVAKGIAVA